ncbi:MAG: GNAT family N-acetyltransferase [Dethiosulfatibacter sp.]|nr:GNAT family N-acetyltransferase [Dethiosulfatibacter sp.]
MENLIGNEKYFIREANESDVKHLVEMRMALESYLDTCNSNLWHVSLDHIDALPEKYSRIINDSKSKVLVVVNNETNEIAGMGIGRIIHSHMFNHKTYGKIDDVWIDENLRNRGLCGSLVNKICDFFRQNDIRHITLEYVSGNEIAASVWGKMGFEPVIIIANTVIDNIRND